MRRFMLIVLTLLLAAALSSFISRPSAFVHAQDKGEPTKPALSTVEGETAPPIEEPTKAPPPDEHTQPEKTPTPLPGQEPTKVPTLAEVTKTPTGSLSSTPTVEPSDTPAPTQEPTQTSAPTSTSMPMAVLSPNAVQVTGVVFNDVNGNGRQDAGEQGMPGIPVVVEDGSALAQVLTTDSGGSYKAQAAPSAIVKVIPPTGWESTGASDLPAADAGDFPLQRVEDPVSAGSAAAAAPQSTALSQAVYDFSTLALAVAALGATIFIAVERLRRALVTQFNSWALTHIRISRESLHITRQAQAALDDPLHVLNQAALDATGENVNLIALPQAVHAPYPAIVTLADDRRRFIFTPVAPEIMRRRENRHLVVSLLNDESRRVAAYPLDALNSGLFIADDLAAIHAAEIKERSAGEPYALPRVQRWYLYVVRSPGDQMLDRKTYLRRRIPTLRAMLRR